MKLISVATAILCAEVAVGARLTEKRRESRGARQLARRSPESAAIHSSQPKITSGNVIEGITNQSNVEYSTNWAGAVLISTGFTEVTGTVTVPTLTGSSSSSVESAGSAVSQLLLYVTKTKLLTGNHHSGSGSMEILARLLFSRPVSTGTLMAPACLTMLGMNGIRIMHVSQIDELQISRYEFKNVLIHLSDTFSGITISAGDSIKMTVTATSETAGSAVIENLTTGTTVTHTFSGESDGSLCEYNAEWIVEDFSECTSSNNCELVPFADFGTVTFTDASAVKSGSTVGVSGATIIDIEQDSEILTSCSASSSTVTCTYTG